VPWAATRRQLETIAMINGFVLNIVRAELAGRAAAADPAQQARQFAMLPELLATGRYPRFAAAIARGGAPETFQPADYSSCVASAASTRSTFACSWPSYPGLMSAFSTSDTREPKGSTASVARFTTSMTVSQSGPSIVVNIASVRFGSPDSLTTRIAAATASDTEPSARPVPLGATENATNIALPLHQS